MRPHGRLDVLVNNAGICDDGPLEQQSLDDLLRVVEVNLISVLDLSRLTADLLRAAPAASVINVASMYGIVASRGPMAAYNASKGALVNLTRHLAAVWGQSGVRVNAAGLIARGLFDPDPAEQVLLADRVQHRRMVGGQVPPDHPDDLVIAIASGYEPALASDQLGHRASPSGFCA